MRDRCNNRNSKDYPYYGGKGVSVSPLWDDFLDFKKRAIENGYREGAGLSIDRIDVNGNYEPVNCRWVDWSVQMNNTSSNHRLTYNGQTHTIAEWSKITGIPFKIIQSRICSYGWGIEKALTTPVNSHRRKFIVDGVEKSLKQLSAEYQINYHTLYNRIYTRGYSLARALRKNPCTPGVECTECPNYYEVETDRDIESRCANYDHG